ncbi:helix-turn-helix domain-containing protein [Scytonema sp. NUACC26]
MKLSEKTGIPEPSLSRFFNSASMPHRTTLYKIANALKLTESQILSKWAA